MNRDNIKAMISGAVFTLSWATVEIFPRYKRTAFALIFPLFGIATSYYLLKSAYKNWPEDYLTEVNNDGIEMKFFSFWAYIPAKYQNWRNSKKVTSLK